MSESYRWPSVGHGPDGLSGLWPWWPQCAVALVASVGCGPDGLSGPWP